MTEKRDGDVYVLLGPLPFHHGQGQSVAHPSTRQPEEATHNAKRRFLKQVFASELMAPLRAGLG